MSKHTSGLWTTRNGRIFPVGKEQSTIASISRDIQDWTLFNEDDARRIVACVNACRGLPTDELEQKGLVAAVGTQLLEADQLRDELLAALDEVHRIASGSNMTHNMMVIRDHCADAIAKAKGGAA